MKSKRLSLAIAALLAAGGMWFAWSAWHKPESQPSKGSTEVKNPSGNPEPGHKLLPPDQTRKFLEMTPEERVKLARQPHGVGG